MRWSTLLGLIAVTLLLPAIPAYAQEVGAIMGRVTSERGAEGLVGAQVIIVGANRITVTDAEGRYLLVGVPAGEHGVRVRLLGFTESPIQRVQVTAGRTVTANFQLDPEAIALKGIVVVGYGTQRRRDLTGSVASISAAALEETPAAISFEQALQGRISGVTVTTNSAEPGGGLSIRIRGHNSISGDNEPLFVIDGFPMSSGGREAGEQGGTQGGNVLANLNPADIESIEVLKDASATAIYGSRGANGVVLITTKAGSVGVRRVRFEITSGFANVGSTIPLANAFEYATFVNTSGRVGEDNRPFWGSCRSHPQTQETVCRLTPDQLAAEVGEGTDWQRALLQTGLTQDYKVDMSGGTQGLTYRVSGGYLDGNGAMRHTGFDRYSLRANLQSQATDRLSVRLNLSGTRSNATRAFLGNAGGHNTAASHNAGTVSQAFRSRPFALPFQWDREIAEDEELSEDMITPLNELLNTHRTNRTDFLLANTTLSYRLTDGLQLTSQSGVNLTNNEKEWFWNTATRRGFVANGEARLNTRSTVDYVTENYLTYRKALGQHAIDATAGFSFQQDDSRGTNLETSDFLLDVSQGMDLFDFAQVHQRVGLSRTQSTLLSSFGRLNYALLDRYLFTVTGRIDGSSKFAANEKYAFFPSGAFAWRISDEPFMNQQDAVSDLKLRLSYGRVGSQGISPYGSLARMEVESFSWGGGTNLGVVPVSAGNQNLKWETTEQVNAGVDLGLANDRVNLTADVYQKTTRDLLQSVRVPATSGFTSIQGNLGSIRNTGVELSVAANLLTGAVGWTSSANFARNVSRVLKLGDTDFLKVGAAGRTDYTHIVREGEPLGTFYGYRVVGLLTAQDIADGYPTLGAFNQEGAFKFWNNPDDEAGIGIINENDKVVLGNAEPDFTLGWSNQFSYGGFQLSAFVNAMVGQDVLNLNRLYTEYGNPGLGVPSRAYLNDHWSPDNPGAYYPRPIYWATAGGVVVPVTDRLVEDGSFVRLKTLSLRYRMPSDFGLGLGRMDIYVAADNLFTITGYSGYDPEVNAWGRNNLIRGVDVDSYPMARTLIVGVSVGN